MKRLQSTTQGRQNRLIHRAYEVGYHRSISQRVSCITGVSASASARSLSSLQAEPVPPSLRFKRVHEQRLVYSVRINLDYRAIGAMREDEIVWFWIGPHAQYEQLLKRFYHGQERWSYSTEFADLVESPEALQPYTPHFHNLLTDLSTIRMRRFGARRSCRWVFC
jgi:hypothetical protein